MTKKEKDDLIQYAKNLSDSELVAEYYDSVYDCLGSDCEAMYELGYDIQDIREAEDLEKYLGEKAFILEDECCKRNITLWE